MTELQLNPDGTPRAPRSQADADAFVLACSECTYRASPVDIHEGETYNKCKLCKCKFGIVLHTYSPCPIGKVKDADK